MHQLQLPNILLIRRWLLCLLFELHLFHPFNTHNKSIKSNGIPLATENRFENCVSISAIEWLAFMHSIFHWWTPTYQIKYSDGHSYFNKCSLVDTYKMSISFESFRILRIFELDLYEKDAKQQFSWILSTHGRRKNMIWCVRTENAIYEISNVMAFE